LNAEIIWMDRIQHGSTMLSPQDMRPLANCKDGYTHICERIIHFLESVTEEDIQKELNYKNSRGQEFSNFIVDILSHIVNHSTHHRAQIAARLREMDIPPPATDYIFYLR
ncbi:MAG: damage-inducible protein DinB, partial [Bacteroidetes bacterium]|nr:damage-inducible protein DinB [Bacteroidota bacterium]